MTELFATAYLASVGIDSSNVNVVDMPLPDMNAALVNHAIDIARRSTRTPRCSSHKVPPSK